MPRALSTTPTAKTIAARLAGVAVAAVLGTIAYAVDGGRVVQAQAQSSSGTWTTAAPMLTGHGFLAAVTGRDGRIYAIGGTNGKQTLGTVEAYTPETHTWTTLASMPTPRIALAAAEGSDGRIYAIGGYQGDGPTLATVEAYDPATNMWTEAAPMSTPRYGLAAATGLDGRIYAIGGCCDKLATMLTSVEVYLPWENRWTPVHELPTQRAGFSAAMGADGRVYVMGGYTSGANPVKINEIFNPPTNTWTTGSDMPLYQSFFGMTLGADGRIYTIGGGGYRRTVQAYDPRSDTWATMPPLHTGRFGLAAVAGHDGRIYALGGFVRSILPSAGSVTTVEVFAPSSKPPILAGTATPTPCQFSLGFQVIHDMIPGQVGTCVDNEAHNPNNGDAIQHTATGLLVWRRADNWTAFTDGYRTWINGPSGLQRRLNTQRFHWEPNPEGLPVV